MKGAACSSTYTRRCSVPLAHDLMTNSKARPLASVAASAYALQESKAANFLRHSRSNLVGIAGRRLLWDIRLAWGATYNVTAARQLVQNFDDALSKVPASQAGCIMGRTGSR